MFRKLLWPTIFISVVLLVYFLISSSIPGHVTKHRLITNDHLANYIAVEQIVQNLAHRNEGDSHERHRQEHAAPKENIFRLCAVADKTNSASYSWIPCKREKTMLSYFPGESSVVEVKSLPGERYLPEIGNGHVATVVQSETIYMNGLYNGLNTTSHRARIPSTAAVKITHIATSENVISKYRMDFGKGVFSEVHVGESFQIQLRRYAHRTLPTLLVTELVVTGASEPVTVSLSVNTGPDSQDINFKHHDMGWFGVMLGETKQAEFPEVAPPTRVTVAYSKVPPNITVSTPTPSHMTFLTSVSLSRMKKGTLFSSHVAGWNLVWRRGSIQLTGNTSMALTTNVALYYLLSSLPLTNDITWPFVGLSPGGLAHGAFEKDYQGHVFWDQDTWMFPPIMLLHAKLGRIIVRSRLRTRTSARHNARQTGFEGARYAWESAFTGLEVSPSRDTAVYEQHVTGDVAWMMRQYLQLTKDVHFLRDDGGYQVLADIANFWVSRVVWNNTGWYEIKDVMGPDEYNFPVNNSVYTNVIAVQSLRSAIYAASLSPGLPVEPQWRQVAAKMFVPLDLEQKYHPEYEHYTRGKEVKQADTILLGFPLEWPMTRQVQANDLDYYMTVTPKGPAMTWGMFAVNWLRIGEKAKADDAFFRGTYNVKGPFKIWTEDADGEGATNFHTGMGGYLQSLLFGYAGFQLHDKGLSLNPSLPPSLKHVSLTGVDYMGHSFDLSYDHTNMNVTLTMSRRQGELTFYLETEKHKHGLKLGQTVMAACQPSVIRVSFDET
ncbi:hypothetical protein BaRGS_00001935 [Batillaria attramentaria]|uniref:Protein-glucosylgalactosylhydroxylysine glucosidase n=1 Tax=Batillaria attramentaria TaxID=370345 RepID=A0ABD0M6P3_9CAEN